MTYATAETCGSLPRADIVAMRAMRIPSSAIARRAGVSVTTLYCALRAWGLTTPRGGDHRSQNYLSSLNRVGGDA